MSPRIVTASPNTTSILLSWFPPLNESQNGKILMYVIDLTGVPFQTSNQMIASNSTASYPSNDLNIFNISGLEEYNNYTITVSAVNSVAQGPPSSPIEVRTLETGKFLIFEIFALISCMDIGLGRFMTLPVIYFQRKGTTNRHPESTALSCTVEPAITVTCL